MRFIKLMVLFALLIPVAAGAQTNTDADLKEIQAYTLTLPVLKQVMTFTRNFMSAVKNDPRFQRAAKLEAEKAAIEKKEEPTEAELQRVEQIEQELDQIQEGTNILGGNKSLSEIEAAAQKEPLIANALKSAGLSARDYAKFMAAYLQAAMIQGFRKSGTIKELPKDTNLENLKFVEEHSKELEAFMKELEALTKKEP